MEAVQLILIIVVIALTTLLIVVGVQVVFIIFEIRRALKRLNSILDDAILGGGMINPSKLTGLLGMFRRKKKMEGYGQQDQSFREEL